MITFIDILSIVGIYRFSRNTLKYGILDPIPGVPEKGVFPGKSPEKARDFLELVKKFFTPGTAVVCNPLFLGDF